MDIKIENMPEYRIAYLRRIGPYGEQNVEMMERLKRWAANHQLLNENAVVLGIAQDDPKCVAVEQCRYDVCIVIPEAFEICRGTVEEGFILGGIYAIFEIEHTAEAVQAAWTTIFKKLSCQGYRQDHGRPIIERYASRMISNHQCEICVPVLE